MSFAIISFYVWFYLTVSPVLSLLAHHTWDRNTCTLTSTLRLESIGPAWHVIRDYGYLYTGSNHKCTCCSAPCAGEILALVLYEYEYTSTVDGEIARQDSPSPQLLCVRSCKSLLSLPVTAVVRVLADSHLLLTSSCTCAYLMPQLARNYSLTILLAIRTMSLYLHSESVEKRCSFFEC